METRPLSPETEPRLKVGTCRLLLPYRLFIDFSYFFKIIVRKGFETIFCCIENVCYLNVLFQCRLILQKTGMIKLKRFLGKYFDIFNSTSSTRGQTFKISIFQLKLLSNPITIFLKTTDHCVFLSIHMHPYHLSLVNYRTSQFGN